MGAISLFILFSLTSCNGCTNNTPKVSAITVAPVLTATAESSSEIDLSWTFGGTNETGFLVERDDGSGAGFQLIATLSGAGLSYQDRGLFPSSTFTYQVIAYNSKYDGPPSNSAAATTLAITWTPLTQSVTSPTPRATHAAIVASLAPPQMIISGGFDNTASVLAEVWSLDLSTASSSTFTWTAGISLPAARASHSAIFYPGDSIRPPQIIVFGGVDLNFMNQDNAVLSLNLTGTPAWSILVAASALPSSPQARTDHCAIYDPVGQRMILFAGDNGGGLPSSLLNDVWELPLNTATPTWNQLNPTGTPPTGRSASTAIYDASDPQNPRMVVFGGNVSGIGASNDVWALQLSPPIWSQLSPSGTPPAIRATHSAIGDVPGERMVAFGGANGAALSNLLGDLWIMNLGGSPKWVQQSPVAVTPPAPRASHTAVYDLGHQRMVVFGGITNTTTPLVTNELWALGF